MNRKHLFRILLVLVLAAILAVGGFSLDILINGKRLPLSRESVRKMDIDLGFGSRPPEYIPLEKIRLTLKGDESADQKRIEATLSLLKKFRYKNRSAPGSGFTPDDALYWVTIQYHHHKETFYIYPNRIYQTDSRMESQINPYYLVANQENWQKEIDRFAAAIYGEKSS